MSYTEEYEVDVTKVKYALYLRKSTDDPGRQSTSIEDQLAACNALIDRLGLHIVGNPIREERSAKRPNNRPLFTKMLADIKRGIYTGIIAWNPDRLARNMMEGGEIINMVDEEQILDLKFVTHHFTRDANGKMLLGMAFVLSKQYSDKLGQDVGRGIQSHLKKGQGSAPKHGYIRGESGQLIPDGKRYDLICDAWSMRRDGESLDKIAEYLNKAGYYREIKSSKVRISMTPQTLSTMFRDSFYYGMLVQASQQVYLPEAYDFQPATTEEDFLTIQEMSRAKPRPYKLVKKNFYPLKMLITCSYCNNHMYVGPSKSSNGEYFLYYRCDTKGCTRPKKSIRAKVIFNFIIDLLKHELAFTKEDYLKLKSKFGQLSEMAKQKLQQELYTKQTLHRRYKAEEDRLALAYASNKLNRIGGSKGIIENRVNELHDSNLKLEEEITQLKEKINLSQQELLTYKQFLNLAKNAAIAVKNGGPAIQDQICRHIFLNLTVDEEKVLDYQLKEPFSTLAKGSLSSNVGVPRLELGASASQTRRSTI